MALAGAVDEAMGGFGSYCQFVSPSTLAVVGALGEEAVAIDGVEAEARRPEAVVAAGGSIADAYMVAGRGC